jgi:hypothetical protein
MINRRSFIKYVTGSIFSTILPVRKIFSQSYIKEQYFGLSVEEFANILELPLRKSIF